MINVISWHHQSGEKHAFNMEIGLPCHFTHAFVEVENIVIPPPLLSFLPVSICFGVHDIISFNTLSQGQEHCTEVLCPVNQLMEWHQTNNLSASPICPHIPFLLTCTAACMSFVRVPGKVRWVSGF